ncbi:MAG TPA: glutaminase A [Pilimelia sp.]|nr:glutaminase A [Pilimelia sp.]
MRCRGRGPPLRSVGAALQAVLDRAATGSVGRVADYIPELATVDPARRGIAVASVRGQIHVAGDVDVPFTLQSVSKPFVYALVAAEMGVEAVARHVGFEPSGEPFNAISLEPGTGRPANPMINAGAIVTAALVAGSGPADSSARLVAALSAFAGRELSVDERVYASESATGDRNRALAHLMRAAGVLTRPVEDAVEVYFRQCAVLADARDLAVMGATLANGGVNPLTGVPVVSAAIARHTLAVMTGCGMYDHAGEWLVRVGLPAKGGVAGGIVAVQPAQVGIGVYSPPLDRWGNSALGVAALTALSQEYDLHVLTHRRTAGLPVVADHVDDRGGRTLTLQGELDFVAVEQILHTLATAAEGRARLRVDVRRVTVAGTAARRMLTAALADLATTGVEVTVTDPGGMLGVDENR